MSEEGQGLVTTGQGGEALSRSAEAVLVIGAGIAGMQAALDIAEAGRKVYLIEREPSVGGHMSQLDKTFPTLDCSACILTPRMVEVARHPNIELLTYSEVEMVEGEAGRFRARIRKKARSVSMDKCTSCGLCVEHCPIRNEPHLAAGGATVPLRVPGQQVVQSPDGVSGR